MPRTKDENSLRLIAVVSAMLLLTSSLNASETALHLRWEDLPASLTGQKVTIVQVGNKKSKGRLSRVEQNDLVLERGGHDQPIARAATLRIEIRTRSRRTRGRLIGTGAGAGIGLVAVALALTFTHNENGANSDKINGVTAGMAAAAMLLGFLAGRESDTDRTVIYIVSK